jgi:hypothetical protein
MKDFNAPGSNKSWMDEGFKKFNSEWQLKNVAKLLDGEVKHYICTSKNETYRKIVIEYDHQQNKKS